MKFVFLLAVGISILACSHKGDVKGRNNILIDTTVDKNELVKSPTPPVSSFAKELELQDDVKEYFEKYKATHNTSYLHKIDSLASLADGAGGEIIGITTVMLFEYDVAGFVRYTLMNRHSHLLDHLMYVKSGDFSVYEGNEKKEEISLYKKNILKQGRDQGLTDKELNHLKELLAKIESTADK